MSPSSSHTRQGLAINWTVFQALATSVLAFDLAILTVASPAVMLQECGGEINKKADRFGTDEVIEKCESVESSERAGDRPVVVRLASLPEIGHAHHRQTHDRSETSMILGVGTCIACTPRVQVAFRLQGGGKATRTAAGVQWSTRVSGRTNRL